MQWDLEGKSAIVTGAESGIGRAVRPHRQHVLASRLRQGSARGSLLFLLSRANSHITGQVIGFNGGELMT